MKFFYYTKCVSIFLYSLDNPTLKIKRGVVFVFVILLVSLWHVCVASNTEAIVF